jgi:hypothetical protein
MKKNLILFVLIMVLFSCQKEKYDIDCLNKELRRGIIAFYPFQNGRIQDFSIKGHDLENPFSLSSTSDRHGNSNCAFLFNDPLSEESEEYLLCKNTNFLNGLVSFSISLWYYPISSESDFAKYETLIKTGSGGPCPKHDQEWALGLFDCRRATFNHKNSVWANSIIDWDDPEKCINERILLSNKWHHVVAIKNDTINKIYINGELNDVNHGDGCCCKPDLLQIIENLYIGNNFTGKIDDIIIFNRELSSTEVMQLYNLSPCCE